MPKIYPTEKQIQDKIIVFLEEYSDGLDGETEVDARRFAQRMIDTLAPMFNRLEREICGL
jgi:hypothetical protein